MSFLHCHTKDCNWCQDDFWQFKFDLFGQWIFGYNPLSLIIYDIKSNIKPRYWKMDSSWARENKFKSTKIHSWRMMIWELKRHFRRIFRQKWWTYKSWKKVSATAVCPKCGHHNFDID